MKKLRFLLLPLLIIISSCYIYKPYQAKDTEELASNSSPSKVGAVSLRDEKGAVNKPPNSKQEIEKKQKADAAIIEEKGKMERQENQKNTSPDAGKSDAPGNSRTQSFSKNLDPELSEKNSKSEKTLSNAQSDETDSIKIKIQPNKYYKIAVEGKNYKIQADQWEGDTLVSHILRKPKKVLRFHKDQIDEEALQERRFSKAYSDLFTVGAYVAGGAAVLLLVL